MSNTLAGRIVVGAAGIAWTVAAALTAPAASADVTGTWMTVQGDQHYVGQTYTVSVTVQPSTVTGPINCGWMYTDTNNVQHGGDLTTPATQPTSGTMTMSWTPTVSAVYRIACGGNFNLYGPVYVSVENAPGTAGSGSSASGTGSAAFGLGSSESAASGSAGSMSGGYQIPNYNNPQCTGTVYNGITCH